MWPLPRLGRWPLNIAPGPADMLRFFSLLTCTAVVAISIAAAASLALSPHGLGATKVNVGRCTTGAVGVTHNLSASNVASVTLSGVPAECGGATVQVTVRNGSSSFSSGSGTIPGAGGSVTVTLSSAVAASTSMQTDLVMLGP